ncbi:N-acetyltransferase [Synechocystis sp. PCC 7339]|uniref:GNAT family N-acetyltransferase n=1 Tax=unclassified Synechocystis TaxID=2640012 RepID=UPI001BB04117|nr:MULTISPECIES: GNAT family N-acetyltransferase [unclassified Synechocystis]QUS59372.1 N-acetyltransferase family protein [Synechocystis sp. PCC 7338]UAJ71558.1 N-acetyltransferase [Synechocystis sp. PCC 7339]
MIPSDLFLRDAIITDLDSIVAIYNANIPQNVATGDTDAITVESRSQWFADHGPDTYPLWVLVTEHRQIVGWLGFQRFYGRPAYHRTAELSIYLDPRWHHRGLGQYLLKTAIAKAPQLGLKTLLGYIFAHNQPSIRLFQRHGFEQWGLLPKVAELGGQERDLLILGLRLKSCSG